MADYQVVISDTEVHLRLFFIKTIDIIAISCYNSYINLVVDDTGYDSGMSKKSQSCAAVSRSVFSGRMANVLPPSGPVAIRQPKPQGITVTKNVGEPA